MEFNFNVYDIFNGQFVNPIRVSAQPGTTIEEAYASAVQYLESLPPGAILVY